MSVYLRHSFTTVPISALINRAPIPPAGLSGPHFLPSPHPPLPARRKSIPPFREADLVLSCDFTPCVLNLIRPDCPQVWMSGNETVP
jgi:hypothetical protein